MTRPYSIHLLTVKVKPSPSPLTLTMTSLCAITHVNFVCVEQEYTTKKINYNSPFVNNSFPFFTELLDSPIVAMSTRKIQLKRGGSIYPKTLLFLDFFNLCSVFCFLNHFSFFLFWITLLLIFTWNPWMSEFHFDLFRLGIWKKEEEKNEIIVAADSDCSPI